MQRGIRLSTRVRSALSGLPEPLKAPARLGRGWARRILYRGRGRFCPVCRRSYRRFARFGLVPRPDAQCPCGALERHRLMWHFVRTRTDLLSARNTTMLHVAPEPCLERPLRRRLGSGFVSVDLRDPRAQVRMDVTRLGFADRTFDVVWCSHVLEHVEEDRRAMREFRRVLKDDGWAMLPVPITAARTVEDPSVRDPAERLRRFGQEDHVRRYGPDYSDRLKEEGFHVGIVTVGDLASPEEAIRMGLTEASGVLHVAWKSKAPPAYLASSATVSTCAIVGKRSTATSRSSR